MITVRLAWTEVLVAAHVGCMRNVHALKQAWKPGASVGLDNTWTPNIEGAAGEMAVAKHLGVYWSGTVGDHLSDDVGPYQVRTNTSRRLTDTTLRLGDREDRIYIGVLSFLPEFKICGWIVGSEGMQQKWLREGTPGRPPCFYVPRDALQPMELLPEIKEAT